MLSVVLVLSGFLSFVLVLGDSLVDACFVVVASFVTVEVCETSLDVSLVAVAFVVVFDFVVDGS